MAKNHGMTDLKGLDLFCRTGSEEQENRFGRMFPHLPPLYSNPEELKLLGEPDGPMDKDTSADRTESVSVAHVFFGQFIDHDITLDVTSSLTAVNDPFETPNVRTPTLDLDCIYGDGPEASPHLYDQQTEEFKGVKLLTGADAHDCLLKDNEYLKHDLSRSSHGAAIIGDPRNDENRIVSQMQLAMIRFHNKVAETLHARNKKKKKAKKETLTGPRLFEETRKLVTWHYQWVVVNDFLRAMCGGPIVDSILGGGRRHYRPKGDPYIPVEFSVAAYRFGHSMVPQNIQVQKNGNAHALFGDIFGEGFSPLASKKAIVDWKELVETDGTRQVQMAQRLDTKMASTLLKLPFVGDGEKSLATRNLLRGVNFLLPSGEKVAEAVGRPSSEIQSVSAFAKSASGSGIDLTSGTPLWYYILCEAESVGRLTEPGKFESGEGLGPTGATLVAEVMIGLIELDERSFLGEDRSWSPAGKIADKRSIDTLGEILTF